MVDVCGMRPFKREVHYISDLRYSECVKIYNLISKKYNGKIIAITLSELFNIRDYLLLDYEYPEYLPYASTQILLDTLSSNNADMSIRRLISLFETLNIETKALHEAIYNNKLIYDSLYPIDLTYVRNDILSHENKGVWCEIASSLDVDIDNIKSASCRTRHVMNYSVGEYFIRVLRQSAPDTRVKDLLHMLQCILPEEQIKKEVPEIYNYVNL